MSKEFEQLKQILTERQEVNNSVFRYIKGKIGNSEIILQQCGIGKVNAAMGTENMITMFSPDIIISSGVAAGAAKNVKPMDIVVSAELAYHDVFCGEDNFFGQIQGLPARYIVAENILALSNSLHYGNTIHKGLILSGDWFVTSKEKIREILSHFSDAKAVDMESCAIAQVCFIRKIPFCSFRIISDNPLEENQIEQYHNFWETMADSSFSVTKDFLNLLIQGI